MVITKTIKFDCAHMLSHYNGKCSNLHGHTYHGTVRVEGDIDAETRMVMDYNTIKNVVDVFDHCIVFSAPEYMGEPEKALWEWAVKFNKDRFVMPYGKSTAEEMAKVIAERIKEVALGRVLVTVMLSETDGSFAEVTL